MLAGRPRPHPSGHVPAYPASSARTVAVYSRPAVPSPRPVLSVLSLAFMVVMACGPVNEANQGLEPAIVTASPAGEVEVPVEAPSIAPAANVSEPAGRDEEPAPPASPERASPFDAYRGAGAWVDMYSDAALANPDAAVEVMAAHGVRTLYLETSSYRRPVGIVRPNVIARFIHAAHARGINVVAWYLPKFENVAADLGRVMEAVGFRTRLGDAFDSFALDIEADLVPPRRRVRNLIDLSAWIRRAVGPDYVLGAIIPSPLGMLRVPEYWPGFPWDRLADSYDVVLPMSYFTFRHDDAEATYDYMVQNVSLARAGVGRRMPVHVIGGLTEDMSTAETEAFLRAVVQAGPFGASLYEFGGSRSVHWAALARISTR